MCVCVRACVFSGWPSGHLIDQKLTRIKSFMWSNVIDVSYNVQDMFK